MVERIKKILYFPVARYFSFFASIRLKRWKPLIIVVTGSNGKTTLLHLLESQIRGNAKYSHHANSSFGIPFDILDLHRRSLAVSEWIGLFIKAPLQVFMPLPKEKIYVVEADADRPNEGKFLAELLQPDILLWVSTAKTHCLHFDYLVENGTFRTVDEAIAYEYGNFVQHTKKMVIIDGESSLAKKQLHRTKAETKEVHKSVLQKYIVESDGTTFTINDKKFHFSSLLPKELYISLAMCLETIDYLQIPLDQKFTYFEIPPGRGTILQGIKKTTLIDSTYNANLQSIQVILSVFNTLQSNKKWVVIGDMLELGNEEASEHTRLAELLSIGNYEKIILVGKLVSKYTYEQLQKKEQVSAFTSAAAALAFMEKNITGSECILFKGSQSIFLEGIIEHLLADTNDRSKLPRQTAFWKNKRKQIGL